MELLELRVTLVASAPSTPTGGGGLRYSPTSPDIVPLTAGTHRDHSHGNALKRSSRPPSAHSSSSSNFSTAAPSLAPTPPTAVRALAIPESSSGSRFRSVSTSNTDGEPPTTHEFAGGPHPLGGSVGAALHADSQSLSPVAEAARESPPLAATPNAVFALVGEWRQRARWIKFEEDVELAGDRWSKPHVAYSTCRALLQLRNCLLRGIPFHIHND